MVHYHDFFDCLHGYCKWERLWLCTTRSMQRWLIITSIQNLWSCSRRPKKCCSMITGVYRPWPSTLITHRMPAHHCKLLILIVWNCKLKIELRYWPCDHLASYGMVHNQKHTNLWYVITTSLTVCMDIANGKDYGCVLTRSMQRWFIITRIQVYGHVTWDPRILAHYCKALKLMVRNCELNIGWPCSLRLGPTHCRHIIVIYLYWWYEIARLTLDYIQVTDPAIIWSHMVLWWSLQQLLEIVTMVWKCNLSHHITVISLICWCDFPRLQCELF